MFRQPPAVERPIYTLPRAILRRDKATMSTQRPINKDERNLESKNSVKRRQAQGISTELTDSEPNRCDGKLADHHPEHATHVKNDDEGISKTLSHSAEATTACTD